MNYQVLLWLIRFSYDLPGFVMAHMVRARRKHLKADNSMVGCLSYAVCLGLSVWGACVWQCV